MNEFTLNADSLDNKVAIFDFGGVISKTLFETHSLTEAALGLDAGTLTWQGPFDVNQDALWQSVQENVISERDYWMRRTEEVSDLIGANWTSMQEFVIAARGAEPEAVIREEALCVFDLLKRAGCRLAILSNELDLFYGAEFRSRLPFLENFDVIVDATYTHILKPDARAYELCFDALGVGPQECVFVDDQLKNIKGAQDINLATVHFDVRSPHASYQKVLNKISSM